MNQDKKIEEIIGMVLHPDSEQNRKGVLGVVKLINQDKPKNPAAQKLGSLGGRAGTGAAKRRSAEHYRRMARARAEQRKARREEKP